MPRHLPTTDLKSTFFNFFASRPRATSGEELSAALAECSVSGHHAKPTARHDNPIKGIYVRFLPNSGMIVLAFYDLREAANAHTVIHGSRSVIDYSPKETCSEPWESGLTCRFISPTELAQVRFLKMSID